MNDTLNKKTMYASLINNKGKSFTIQKRLSVVFIRDILNIDFVTQMGGGN